MVAPMAALVSYVLSPALITSWLTSNTTTRW